MSAMRTSKKKRAARSKNTPIRSALKPNSPLQESVAGGLSVIINAHRGCLANEIRQAFSDSLNLDEALREAHPQENRWDYLLGHKHSGAVVGLEPHSAKQDQISTVIKKKEAATNQLKGHLQQGQAVKEWFWVASNQIYIKGLDKAYIRLVKHGITFVGRQLRAQHLQGY